MPRYVRLQYRRNWLLRLLRDPVYPIALDIRGGRCLLPIVHCGPAVGTIKPPVPINGTVTPPSGSMCEPSTLHVCPLAVLAPADGLSGAVSACHLSGTVSACMQAKMNDYVVQTKEVAPPQLPILIWETGSSTRILPDIVGFFSNHLSGRRVIYLSTLHTPLHRALAVQVVMTLWCARLAYRRIKLPGPKSLKRHVEITHCLDTTGGKCMTGSRLSKPLRRTQTTTCTTLVPITATELPNPCGFGLAALSDHHILAATWYCSRFAGIALVIDRFHALGQVWTNASRKHNSSRRHTSGVTVRLIPLDEGRPASLIHFLERDTRQKIHSWALFSQSVRRYIATPTTPHTPMPAQRLRETGRQWAPITRSSLLSRVETRFFKGMFIGPLGVARACAHAWQGYVRANSTTLDDELLQ